jgi:hypothetical protein
LLCRLAPDGGSDFLKDRWLPGTWGSCRLAWNAEGERGPLGVKPSDRPGYSLTPRMTIWSDPSGSAAAAEALEAVCGPFLTRAVRQREV